MAYRGWRRNGTKYNAHKTEVDGIEFPSKHEANRYCELKLLERAGEISDLRLQVDFELIPNQYRTEKRYGKNGKELKDKEVLLERKVVYRADFVYTDKDGSMVVEDTKGFKTKEYLIKRKLMLYVHGIQIQEV